MMGWKRSSALAVLLLGGLAACHDHSRSGGASAARQAEPLLIASIDPPHQSTGVRPGAYVEIRFSRPPDPATVNGNSLRLLDAADGSVVACRIEAVPESGEPPAAYRIVPCDCLEAPSHPYWFQVAGYRIRAADGTGLDLGKSPAKAPARFTTLDVVDRDPPTFFFLDRRADAEGSTTVRLSWWPAADAPGGSSPDALRYAIYEGEAEEAIDFDGPAAVTGPGVVETRIEGLLPSTTYFFVVRARDEWGNEDSNRSVVSARTWFADGPVSITFLYTAEVFGFLEPCG
jgi:hypothetical protein